MVVAVRMERQGRAAGERRWRAMEMKKRAVLGRAIFQQGELNACYWRPVCGACLWRLLGRHVKRAEPGDFITRANFLQPLAHAREAGIARFLGKLGGRSAAE